MHVSRGPSDADLDELRELEAAMWRSGTRGDRSWMDQCLARDFTEFGRSGRRYTRAEILDLDISEIHATLPLRDLQCRRLGGGVVLVTYKAEVDGRLANRSSIWRLTDAGWQMEFHQGTPTTATDTTAHPSGCRGCPGVVRPPGNRDSPKPMRTCQAGPMKIPSQPLPRRSARRTAN